MAKEKRRQLGRRNKVKYLFIRIADALFVASKNKSKHTAFQESYERDRTRQSEAIHSHSTHDTYVECVAKRFLVQ